MPPQTLLQWEATTVARAGLLSPKFNATSRSSANDFLHWTLDLTANLAAALGASFRLIGAAIDIDKGDGALTRLTQAEIGGAIDMHGSADAFGRALTFTVKAPPSQISLLLSSWTRGLHRVRMTGYIGMPGAVQSRTVFDGFIRQATFGADTSEARIDCQDASIRWSTLQIVYNLDPATERTRKQIFLDLCTAYGMTPGVLDFGPNDGGVVFKGISEGGTNQLLAWIRDFLTPIARKISFSQSGTEEINVLPFDGTSPAVRTFNASDIQSLSIAGPATNDPNTVMMSSSTVFAYIGPSGQRTEVSVVPHFASIAPGNEAFRRARQVQDATTGAITNIPQPDFVILFGQLPTQAQVGETRTTRVFDGGTIVYEEVEEHGYYAPRACNRRIDAGGGNGFNNQFNVYRYADGSWRTTGVEIYQVIRLTQRTKTFDVTSGLLVTDSTKFSEFRPVATPYATLDIDHVMTSPDGITWTPRASAAANGWIALTFGGGVFVAVAQTGTGNRVMTSPDGAVWTIRASAADNPWTSVAYGGGVFVAVANGGTGNRVMTSPDGITWTSQAGAPDKNWLSVTYGAGVFVAVAGGGTGNIVMTSPDGVTWTPRPAAANDFWTSVTFGNGLFVAVSSSGTVMTSPSGSTWTTRTAAVANAWQSVTFGGGLFVAVALSGFNNRVMTSPDGITWTSRTSAANNSWTSVTGGNGLFVATASDGIGTRVMTSPDGITWTIQTGAPDNSWFSVIFANGLFASVAIGGTAGPLNEIAIPCLATDAGEAWVNGAEEFNSYTVAGVHAPFTGGSEGAIVWVVSRPQPAYAAVDSRLGASVFGPTSSKQYGQSFSGTIGPSWSVAYSAINEQNYRIQTSLDTSNTALDQPVAAPLPGVEIVVGTVPMVEQLTSFQTSQAATVIVVDNVRAALFGGQVIDARQNDFCETTGELRVAAMEISREMGAPVLDWVSIIDWTTDEGATVALAFPEVGGSPKNLIATDIAWRLNFATNEFTMHITAKWFPPELVST